jgi:predicted transcriptional regulator of viral defense system
LGVELTCETKVSAQEQVQVSDLEKTLLDCATRWI